MPDIPTEPGWCLESAAEDLAERHILAKGAPRRLPALIRLSETERWLRTVRRLCTDPPEKAAKAAEWLLDNDYQVFRALRQIRSDLPPDFYSRLPALASGADEGLPRIFAIAHEYLHCSRLQVSSAGATRFIGLYQQKAPLRIAELWAFPTVLRIACVEMLVWSLTQLLDSRVPLPFTPSSAAQETLSLEPGEHVARAIANLAEVAAISWEDFFDQTSLVEEVLRTDPSGSYPLMDFESRDRYRHAVEEIGAFSGLDERDVAARAIERAQVFPPSERAGHVGYWIAAEGRREFEQGAGAGLPRSEELRRFALEHPGLIFAAGLLICGAAALFVPIVYLLLVQADLTGWVLGLLLVTLPASALAVAILNWAITRALPPRTLFKLDFRKGLPDWARTLIAVPAVVSDEAEARRLAEQIESHWLSSADPNLQIALLADLKDAPKEALASDEAVIEALRREVRGLNDRYAAQGSEPFHLLMRPRLYNEAQGCWMAWERKRGKLEQLNRMILEGDDSAFSVLVGNRAALSGVSFVVTLDADTQLPPDSVAKLAGALAHPLNRACFDPASERVVSGYSIIQPRVEISPRSGHRSAFTRLFTGDTAIDIYSRAVSDVYQDLFGTGIFVGKGIYSVRDFHRSLNGCVPENAILSHDLFEGAHGRAALASDIVFYEGFPPTYLGYARRLHRWIRGDWQLVGWLGNRVRRAKGVTGPNKIRGIDRWKLFDNLRRSLVAPALLLLALGGWFMLPGSPWFWTALVLLTPGGQLFAELVSGFARGRRGGAATGAFPNLLNHLGRWFLALVYLLHEALLSTHAIALTLWRLVRRKRLLDWTAAAHVSPRGNSGRSRRAIWRAMWTSPAIALFVALALALDRPAGLIPAAPLLLLWIGAPEITYRTGRRRRAGTRELEAGQAEYLRMLARQTWFYFESFAGPEANWLPPDNYQEEPHSEIAHRTSPTNVGMMLLSAAAARDLGFIGSAELAARVSNSFESLGRLDRYRGHFFNWYDTRTLKPLEPRYVSSVDSGNLAMCLVALAAALREAVNGDLEPKRWKGLEDTARLLDLALSRLGPQAAPLRELLAVFERRLEVMNTEEEAGALEQAVSSDLPQLEERLAQLALAGGPVEIEGMREAHAWLERLGYQIRSMKRDLEGAAGQPDLLLLAAEAEKIAYEMDFGLLYDSDRRLLHIGYNVTTGRLDPHHYDLLASEARLASFFAIAKGDLPLEHWFHLQRPLRPTGGHLALLSWNGSMFEYLMPRLLLRSGPETLLEESERVAVAVQRRHGQRNAVPWGISESAFAARDPDHRYRYLAFGVPDLGLRRGLGRDMVVAPYASALALAVDAAPAAANLERLDALGARRRFGMVEAVDFSPERRVDGGPALVTTYMAHHQGMILAAIDNALNRDIFVKRVGRDPRVRAIYLLLSERVPRHAPREIERLEARDRPPKSASPVRPPPSYEPVKGASFPQVNLLGNGQLHSWTSDAGGGGLKWHGNALTRFNADPTCDADGVWIYLADEDSGALWSATRQPTASAPGDYRVLFHPHLSEFRRRDEGIQTSLEIAVAPGTDLEVRRLTIVNESKQPRRLRVTSYGEVVLAPPLDDERHPAFSKLFVGSEPVPHLNGVLFTRRPRGPAETPPTLLHFLVSQNITAGEVLFECDRGAFIGRNRDTRDPAGAREKLANNAGWTLDPVMSLQLRLDLAPFERRELCFVTLAASSREAALEAAERHMTPAALEWALSDASTQAARNLERIDPKDWPAISLLASLLTYPSGTMRCDAPTIRASKLGQPQLWGLGLSGDLPILVVRNPSDREILLTLVAAQNFWRIRGLACDLVLLQTSGSGYAEPVRDEIGGLLDELGLSAMLGRSGGVHLIFSDQVGAEQTRLAQASARVVLDAEEGLGAAVARAFEPRAELPQFTPSRSADYPEFEARDEAVESLSFDNGFGGFAQNGREYVIRLGPGATTPAPWCNILANDDFGCLVSESGLGFSWAMNSGEHRLTPWVNDPVSDRTVEALYLRDEETAAVWTVTPAPAGRNQPCEIRHCAGHTIWRQVSHGVEQEMTVLVPPDSPVKLVRLRLKNLLEHERRLTATYYAEWLMGALPSRERERVHCDFDQDSNAIFARNNWNPDFAGRIAFLGAGDQVHAFTTSRLEFLGKEGNLADPAGLRRWGLSGATVAAEDPCAAYQVHIDLAPNDEQEVTFLLGEGADEAEARALLSRWREPGAAAAALSRTTDHWDSLLEAIQVETPDPAFDIIINRWLLYQCLSSRIHARAGFYQAGGAFGFRDQLQDFLALLHAVPSRARAHILASAAHQFEQGDVMHWWHPPSDRGVRTRCSDDLLWLPYAVATYVEATGDLSILEERVPFLTAPELSSEEEDRYDRFPRGDSSGPLLDHCHRALERALTRGAHGLPLIGSGDWNDGMNRLGREGRGESVWLAWFLTVTAGLVARLDRRLGDERLANHWQARADALRQSAEEAGWDGAWYRRAYNDEGHAIGAERNLECRIDSISQSWSWFAGADEGRSLQALKSAADELIDEEEKLARLLWPPFDRTISDPGYIKAYPPGIRENGGQYSHAAAWLGLAFARAGDGARAKALFDMLNPIGRTRTASGAKRYRVEPYVVAGDIATVGAHRGRGGWTWYTGAAAWAWRLGVEGMLGLQLVEGRLSIAPCLPPGWKGFKAVIRGSRGSLAVEVTDPDGIGSGRAEIRIAGKLLKDRLIDFPADGSVTQVDVRITR